jgi:iron complex outermembrane receptor protein
MGYDFKVFPSTLGTVRIKYQDGEADLSNFQQRELSNRFLHRNTDVEVEAYLTALSFETIHNNLVLNYGIEFEDSKGNAFVRPGPEAVNKPGSPTPFTAAFFIDDYRRSSVFSSFFDLDWQGSADWYYNFGLRSSRIKYKGRALSDGAIGWDNPVGGPIVPLRLLYDEFQAADTDFTEHLYDAVLSATRQIKPSWDVSFSLAHHNSPADTAELFVFIPSWPIGAMTDGHNYMGNPTLDNSRAIQYEIKSRYKLKAFYLGLRVYFDDIKDYIQGISIKKHGSDYYTQGAIEALNGSGNYWDDENPLQFQNIDAEIWGVDLSVGSYLFGNWFFRGAAAYMRGKNKTHDDHLYRMIPPYMSLDLSYILKTFEFSYNLIGVAEQGFSSRDSQPESQGRKLENETSGYALHSVRFRWSPHPAISMNLGVENIFDREYVDHLAPYNIIENSDLGLKEQIPGVGRNIYAKFLLRFD